MHDIRPDDSGNIGNVIDKIEQMAKDAGGIPIKYKTMKEIVE